MNCARRWTHRTSSSLCPVDVRGESIDTWRSDIIVTLQVSGELSLDAAARVDLFGSDDAGSPLIECVVEGELLSAALANVAVRVTQRPRVHWAAIPPSVSFPAYELHRALCDSYRVIPLLVVAGQYVALGMVDPSWSAAREAMEDLFGLPTRIFVLAYTDYIFVTRPELAPDTDDLDNADTWAESPAEEVLELLTALHLGSEHSDDSDLRTSNVGVYDDDLDERAASASQPTVDPPLASVRQRRVEPVTPAVGIDTARSGGAGIVERIWDTLDDERAGDSSLVDTASPSAAIRRLLEAALASTDSQSRWTELFDVLSLFSTAAALCAVQDENVSVRLLVVGGCATGTTTQRSVRELLTRALRSSPHRPAVHVARLDGERRDERALLAYAGNDVMIVTAPDDASNTRIIAVFGVFPSMRRDAAALGALVAEHTRQWPLPVD